MLLKNETAMPMTFEEKSQLAQGGRPGPGCLKAVNVNPELKVNRGNIFLL